MNTKTKKKSLRDGSAITCFKKYLLFLMICFGLKNNLLAGPKNLPNQVLLRSKDLTVSIDKTTGLPNFYYYQGSVIRGADSLKAITATVCRLAPRKYFNIQIKPSAIRTTAGQVDVIFDATCENIHAATFHIRYVVSAASLVVTVEDVKEYNGFELIESRLPNLASVREEDGNTWLAHAGGGGELVELKNARPNQMPADGNFGEIGYVLPVAMIGTAKAACIMEVTAFMDGTKIGVAGRDGHRHASIGTIQVYRVHGGRAYNMNNGEDDVKGNEHTPNLLVGQQSRCRLDFVGDYDHSGAMDWVDGAKIVAARMPPAPTKYFDDKFIYLIGGNYKAEKEPRTTFKQSEKLIADIAAQIDYAPQLPLVSGWVYDGQDTGFPSEDSVNERLGGYEELMHLMAQGPRYNANVSLNVNYDDAYKSSPLFDTAFIARQPDGRIWRGRDWAGEYSYIVGMAKYMQKWGEPRMDYTLSRYKIHDALLIDAMSWFAIRNDWDPIHPASGYKNLVDGKFKIIEGFRKRGIDVISEHLRYPFIGKLACSADGFGGGSNLFGGEPIPLLAAIYRKSAIWGSGDFPRSEPQRSLFWNCRSIQWYTNTTDRQDIISYYYLTVLPFNKIHHKGIVGYHRNGFKTDIQLESKSEIMNDWMDQSYSIIANGVEVAGNNATYCPIDSNKIAFFSKESRELKADLPAGWNREAVVARVLFTDHREPIKIDVEQGKIVVNVTGGLPVIVYRNQKIADQQH